MRYCGLLLLLLPLCFASPVFSQPSDSALRHRDSMRHAVQEIARKHVEQLRDSIEAARIKENVKKNGKPLDAFLAEMKEREKAKQRQFYFRIAFIALFVIAVVVGLLRMRRR